MRNARLIFTVLVFCAAGTGSIWIGWIYAGSQLESAKPSAVVVTPRLDEIHQNGVGAIGQYQELGLPPDMSDLNIVPGVPGGMGNSTEIDGFPTISKDAIERAAGYSDHSGSGLEPPIPIGPGALIGD